MRVFALILLSFIVSAPALAGACYGPDEAEAEQAIRIHSELMVIGLNCQHMAKADGANLYVAYRSFTSRYAAVFAEYEATLIAHYTRSGNDPEKALHTLRTNFANKVSNEVAQERPDVFCTINAPRVTKAVRLDGDGIRSWAATSAGSSDPSQPLCGDI